MGRTQITPDDQLAKLWEICHTSTDLVHGAGAEIVSRHVCLCAQSSLADLEPIVGLRAQRQIELGASHAARVCIRQAGGSRDIWHASGQAPKLTPCAGPGQEGTTLPEASPTYVARRSATGPALAYGRSFASTWRSYDGAISDSGLLSGLADDERGGVDDCPCASNTIIAGDAEGKAKQ